jgi:transcriptional regulator GlxA family with amidase domain
MVKPVFDHPRDLPRYQRKWLDKLESIILQYNEDRPLSVAELAKAVCLSERQLYRQIKQLLGITPNNLIQELRLRRAQCLLESGAFPTVAEVAYAAGFNCPEYFSNLFYKKYGERPTRLLWKDARVTRASIFRVDAKSSPISNNTDTRFTDV